MSCLQGLVAGLTATNLGVEIRSGEVETGMEEAVVCEEMLAKLIQRNNGVAAQLIQRVKGVAAQLIQRENGVAAQLIQRENVAAQLIQRDNGAAPEQEAAVPKAALVVIGLVVIGLVVVIAQVTAPTGGELAAETDVPFVLATKGVTFALVLATMQLLSTGGGVRTLGLVNLLRDLLIGIYFQTEIQTARIITDSIPCHRPDKSPKMLVLHEIVILNRIRKSLFLRPHLHRKWLLPQLRPSLLSPCERNVMLILPLS